MRRRSRSLGMLAVFSALLMTATGALPASAAPVAFGAKLNRFSQPANAEGGRRCDKESGIPDGSVCTWVSTEAYQNGDRFRAPKDGRIGRVRLVSCIGGRFTLQIVRKLPSGAFKLVRNGPVIRYQPDPFVSDGDPQTVCGGEDGEFVVQSFAVDVPITKGSYIAIKAKRAGTLYCAGGSGVELIAPPLTSVGQSSQPDDSTSCNLLISLRYRS